MPPPLPPSLPTDRLKLFSGVQHKHSSCSFACPAFRSTSVSGALAYAHPDDAAQQSQQNPHHQNAPQQHSTLPRLALALATPDTKWRTQLPLESFLESYTAELALLQSHSGLYCTLYLPIYTVMTFHLLIHTASAFQLCYQALPC